MSKEEVTKKERNKALVSGAIEEIEKLKEVLEKKFEILNKYLGEIDREVPRYVN